MFKVDVKATLLCLALLGTPLSFRIDAQSAPPSPASSPSLTALLDALKSGRNVDALRYSADLVRTNPDVPKIWILRAVSLERLNHPKEALAAYQYALKLAPDSLPALEGAAQLEYKAQSPAALPLLRHILSIDASNSIAHAMLGVLEVHQQDDATAASDFAAAGDALRTQPDALMAYAVALARLNRTDEAIDRLRLLLDLQPANLAARFDCALLQWRTGSAAQALATIQPAIDAQTADSSLYRLAAAIHEAANETPQAVELLRSAIVANPDEPSNYVEFATLASSHGSFAVGIDFLNRGLTRLPQSAALYMARGVLYGQNGDFEKAMADFEQAHKLDPASSIAATAEGIAQSQRHNHEAAREDFRRQVREHPNDAYGHYLLAEALSWAPPEDEKTVAEKQPDTSAEAIAAAERAIQLDPRLVQAYDLLGTLYLQTGESDEAIHACHTALSLNPKDQQAVYTLILALRKTGAREEARTLVQTLTDLRKAEATENGQRARYGRLIEQP